MPQWSPVLQVAATNRSVESGAALLQIGGAVLLQSRHCPFCHPTPAYKLLTETATVYAVLVKAPDAPVHALVIPKLHVADYFVLPEKVRTACWLVAERVCGLMKAMPSA
jgi:hypothetical protein